MKKVLISGLMLTAFFAFSSQANNHSIQTQSKTESLMVTIPAHWVLVARWTVDGVTYKKYWTGVDFVIIDDSAI